MWISLRFLFFSSFKTEKALHQDGLWCKASNFFLYVFMSFFYVFSGAPHGSDFLILTKGIIKKVPKRSAKKYVDYSNSTITNQFCLEIICCRVCFSFDFLIYPYYPAYMGWCYQFVIGIDNKCPVTANNIVIIIMLINWASNNPWTLNSLFILRKKLTLEF